MLKDLLKSLVISSRALHIAVCSNVFGQLDSLVRGHLIVFVTHTEVDLGAHEDDRSLLFAGFTVSLQFRHPKFVNARQSIPIAGRETKHQDFAFFVGKRPKALVIPLEKKYYTQ